MKIKKLSKKSLEFLKNDKEYKEHVLEGVRDDGDYWDLKANDAYLACIKNKDFVPKSGMMAKFYGKGFGYPVRRVIIDGHIMFYRTPQESEQDHKDWCERNKKESIKRFNKNKNKYQKDYKSLPDLLKTRMDRLRQINPKDRYEWEPYELFILTRANEFAKYLKTIENIESWKKISDFEEQKKTVPTLDYGHSVNTFANSICLAKKLINGEYC